MSFVYRFYAIATLFFHMKLSISYRLDWIPREFHCNKKMHFFVSLAFVTASVRWWEWLVCQAQPALQAHFFFCRAQSRSSLTYAFYVEITGTFATNSWSWLKFLGNSSLCSHGTADMMIFLAPLASFLYCFVLLACLWGCDCCISILRLSNSFELRFRSYRLSDLIAFWLILLGFGFYVFPLVVYVFLVAVQRGAR